MPSMRGSGFFKQGRWDQGVFVSTTMDRPFLNPPEIPMDHRSTAETNSPRIRWWPAVLIVAGAGAVLVFIRFFKEIQRQDKNLESLAVLLATGGLLLIWMLLFSRIRWRLRLGFFAVLVALFGFVASCFEITGVSGDLVPIIAWRWRPDAALPSFDDDPSTRFARRDKGNARPTDQPPRDDAANHRDGETTDGETTEGAKTEGAKTEGATTESRSSAAGRDGTTQIPAFPQFRGPSRNSILDGPSLDRDWDAHPPTELWRQKIGGGCSGFATFDHFAITMEQRGPDECVTCYDLLTGTPIWSHRYEAFYESTVAGDGPRTVPTIVDGRLFAIGSTGVLSCLELTTGECVWSRNVLIEHDQTVPEWGFSASPLVTKGLVIVGAGGPDSSLVGYDAGSGAKVWGGGSDPAHYSAPVLATLGDVEQVLLFLKKRISAHRLTDGAVLWDYDWFGPAHPNVTMPIVLPGDRVLASAGYGEGTDLVQVRRNGDAWSTELIWRSKRLKSKFGTVIVLDGYAYGLDDGVMTCIDLSDGSRAWKKGRYGHGQMLLVKDLFVILTEKGDVVLVEPEPTEHREVARFTALHAKTWNPLALAGDYLLIRNEEEAACFRLPLASSPGVTTGD